MQSKDSDWCISTDVVGSGDLQENMVFIVLMVYSLLSNALTLNIAISQIVKIENQFILFGTNIKSEALESPMFEK